MIDEKKRAQRRVFRVYKFLLQFLKEKSLEILVTRLPLSVALSSTLSSSRVTILTNRRHAKRDDDENFIYLFIIRRRAFIFI